ncbi:extracellular solute-binding protein [Paenibacillus koleovorans]|uniref:extracellular solute-binding protein n=1 Tax=Paenibacillus koleovorans TaxID=121608 RepID=UPI000FD91881|nr:extracellular solute-binding protein [Paenibacillus koleovorans]
MKSSATARSIALMASFLIVLSACSSSEPPATVGESPGVSSSPTPKAGKFDPPVELSIVGEVYPTLFFDGGSSYEKNSVFDAYERDLGIKLTKKWTIASNQYSQKVTLSIASGDIPDLMRVTASELQQLIDNDMLADLSAVYDKFASPQTKKFMMVDGGKQLDSAKYNGKLMAIPATDSPYNAAQFVYIRNDWLQKLNLQPPKTMSDLLAISEAFTNRDPDGNGKKDSYGFAAQKEIYNANYGFLGMFYGHHAYPQTWVKDATGNLVYGSIQPQMKAALKVLQDLYKSGQIDPEFYTKDHAKESQLAYVDQIGMTFGPFYAGNSPLWAVAVKNRKLTQDWSVFPLVSADSSPAKTVAPLGVKGYYVVSKKTKNPEAVIQLLNHWIKIDSEPLTAENRPFKYGKLDQGLWQLNPLVVTPLDQYARLGGLMSKAVAAKDNSSVKDDVLGSLMYQETMAFLNGDDEKWGTWMKTRPGGSMELMNQYLKEDRYMFDEFISTPTLTMASKKSILDQKELEVMTSIITNKAPIEEFDKFVEEWKTLGGSQITKEVNEWYAAKGKK